MVTCLRADVFLDHGLVDQEQGDRAWTDAPTGEDKLNNAEEVIESDQLQENLEAYQKILGMIISKTIHESSRSGITEIQSCV